MENLIVLIGIGAFAKYAIKRYKITVALVDHMDELYGRKET